MAWLGIEGHDVVAQQFEHALARGRLASTFLFIGPPGIGKRAFALKLAQALLCPNSPPDKLAPCGQCDSCVQAAAGTNPDILQVCKPPDKANIPIELFIGPDDKRMREGLIHDLGLRPFLGKRKVAIVDDADHFRVEGANSLLKTLEEPPPQSVLILIGTSPERQLPTIRSRAQTIRFQPLPTNIVEKLLIQHELVDDPAEARRLAAHSEGSLERALALADPELWKFRDKLLAHLGQPDKQSGMFAQEATEFVDAAGKEAPPRRERLRQVLTWSASFYRELLRRQCGVAGVDADLAKAVERAIATWPRDSEITSAAIDRCLDALLQVDRNVHQATLIECWLDDLAGMAQGVRA